MDVHSLISDRNNTLGQLPSKESKVCQDSMDDLARHAFWSSRGKSKLWPHQKSAIALSLAYLSAPRRNPRYPNLTSAALLKLPTGTGKTGIIAVLVRALADIRVTLVVTPREALVRQLMQDLSCRFWEKLGYTCAGFATTSEHALDVPTLPPPGTKYAAIDDCKIVQMLPVRTESEVRSCLNNKPDRAVLVSTFATLQSLHSMHNRDDTGNDTVFALLREHLDLLVIDEGHYEPAVRWGRAVRALSKPTILLSATPYRNDFKAFNVDVSFVYNLPLQTAQGPIDRSTKIKRTIRQVEAKSLDTRGPATLANYVAAVRRFADRYLTDDDGEARGKLIVRSDSFDALKEMHRLFARHEPCVLVHHRITTSNDINRTYHSYEQARHQNTNIRLWLHDSKLLEGVDDPSFQAVVFHQNYRNDRNLVQQIGRVLRSTDPSRRALQTAYYSAIAKDLEEVERRWERYVIYEQYLADDVGHFLRSDVALPEVLMEVMPKYQYARDQFRETFNVNTPSCNDLRIPMSAGIWEGAEIVSDSILTQEIEDALYESDRFGIQQISDMPKNSLGFVYYAWQGSPLTHDTFFAEWRLGLLVVVRCRDLLFFSDTEGLPFSPKDFGLSRVSSTDMQRLFPHDEVAPNRVNRLSFINLDISDTAIRSQVTRTHSFQNTFTDLADHSLVPTSASGVVNLMPRYAGFTRARVSERATGPLTIPSYVERVEQIAAELESGSKSAPLFTRYAMPLDQCDEEDGKPRSILLDLTDILNEFELMNHLGDSAAEPIDFDSAYHDLCSDVDNKGDFTIRVSDQPVECNVEYNASTGRYSMASSNLSDHFAAKDSDKGDSIVAYLNRTQSFRIVTNRSNVVYAHRRFYEITLRFTDDVGGSPILSGFSGSRFLSQVHEEKGDAFHTEPRWATDSIFGFVYEHGKKRRATANSKNIDSLERDIRSFDVLVCDDGPKEFCDFIGIDETGKRVALIHAKVSRKQVRTGIAPLQVVARQALASLALVSRLSRLPEQLADRWDQPLRISGMVIERIVKETGSDGEATERVARCLADPSFAREVWIVLGKALDLRQLNAELTRAGGPTARLQQFAYFVDSLRTAFARANTAFRVYCPDQI